MRSVSALECLAGVQASLKSNVCDSTAVLPGLVPKNVIKRVSND